MIECEGCGKFFQSEKSLHCHLKAHKLSVAEYYEKYHPRYDLYSKAPIKYKTREQYLHQEFNSRSNMQKWLAKFEPEDPVAQVFLESKLLEKLESKNSKFAPCNLYLELTDLPTKRHFNFHFGDYNLFVKSIGLKNQYTNLLPNNFWSTDLALNNLSILVDTREQKPLNLTNCKFQKLDFGDYTATGKYYSNTFIERKSAADFASTMSNGIDRFRKELDRCIKFNSYMFVTIESEPKKIYSSVKRNFKPNMDYIWHNTRQMMLDYPNNLQFVFTYNRSGSKHLIPRLLFFGRELWNTDVQYFLQRKIELSRKKETNFK